MRISPVLLLLPALVLSGACPPTVPSAIATDDRPASPQPAIASPVAAPLTIESLAGTYKGVVNEEALKEWVVSTPVKQAVRQFVEQMSIKINANGTFEATFVNNYSPRGEVKLDGNKLILIDSVAEPSNSANGSTNIPECSESCGSMLYVSTDGKTLLNDSSSSPPQPLIRAFVKQ